MNERDKYLIGLTKRVLGIFARPDPFTNDDYSYLSSYLALKVEELKKGPWIKHVPAGQDPDTVFRQVLITIIQALSLANTVLETRGSETEYAANLEKLEDISYLSQKAIKSNINSPQCLNHKCKDFPPKEIDTVEELIPFTICLQPLDSANYENVEGDKESAQLAVNSLGRIVIYFNAYVICEVVRTVCHRAGKSFKELVAKSKKLKNLYKFAADLNNLHKNVEPNVFNKETFKKYEVILADKKSKKTQVMLEIQRYLFYAQIQQNKTSLHYLEKLLIQLLGHYDFDIRDKSIVCLNMLYDGVDWQFGAAFEPKVTCVKSQFVIEETIISKRPLNYVLLFLNAPAFCTNCPLITLTWHPVKAKAVDSNKDQYEIKFSFERFWRCGFFDWKLMEIDSEGKIVMLKKFDSENNETFAQGRYIVHPEGVNEQQIHEIVVDYKDQDSDPNKDFFTLAQEIPKYAEMGINCLYLMGALERDNGLTVDEESGEPLEVKRPHASPLAIIDRSEVSRMLGGAKGYQTLMNAANKYKMKILVDCMARVSSSRPHRKYRKVLLHTMDNQGKRTLCYGTDGRSVNYEDSAILNYRKLSSWNILVQDTIKVVEKYKISGVYLDNAQTWPVILELDEEELYRKDPDGVQAYTDKEILDGGMVRQCEGQGYWDSDSLIRYPNPIFVKLCRALWSKFPDFLVIGECLGGTSLENRQGILARSGVIPRLFKLPIALASIFGKKLVKDGQVMSCKPDTVRVLKTWYENNRRFTPEGSYLIQSLTSHIWPYPALLYGRGAWSAVDVLFFMPDIPMTFMGEIFGNAYRRNITSVYQAKPLPKQYMTRPKSQLHLAMEGHEETATNVEEPVEDKTKGLQRVRSLTSLSVVANPAELRKKDEEITQQLGPQFGFDLKKIHLHYEHRRKLRNEKSVLRYGELVILEAKHSEGTHPHVLAFARFSPSETAVIATNFTDRNVSFYIDMTKLLPLMQKHYQNNIVALFSDWSTSDSKEYYFLRELINDKIFMTLKPFSSLCKEIVICKNDPYAFAVALEESAIRLNTKIIKNIDCGSAQLCLQLINVMSKYSSLNDFYMSLTAINKLYAIPNKLDINTILMNAFKSSDNTKNAGLCLEYCKRILNYKEKLPISNNYTSVPVAQDIINYSKLGPIVFLTPEVGRWSTVGGLGVMVDELSQGYSFLSFLGLAALGEEVYLIAVYYERNRKGETGYLERDPAGFKYTKNVKVNAAGGWFELGVHTAVVNGVNLIFLHHGDLYPSPYPDWGAAATLKQIVVFCKAALEYLCSEKLIPAVIVTNDWFTALTPAYGKYGAFGDVFKGTTFLHIFHNLQETYEGRLYPSPSEGNLEWIHQLDCGLLMDPYWKIRVINPSRCATLASDQWATVSKSYRDDLISSSPLSPLLRQHPRPFAFPNGIPIQARLKRMKEQVGTDHLEAKRKIQQKYFKYNNLDDTVPVFAFVGRITSQKGVHLICESAEHLIGKYHGKVNILVGGPANRKEPYANGCAIALESLAARYPHSFWAAPNEFFIDGALINLGADFGLMPSAFEPGGIVQHEFFVGGTPVVAFKTGGLKDSVFEYNWDRKEGNGFTFESFNKGDFIYAVERAIGTFMNKENYTILRKNAFNSTMDGATVSKEWCKEFYRLRGKLFAEKCTVEVQSKIPTEWNYNKYNDSYLDEYMYKGFITPEEGKELRKFEPLAVLAKRQSDTKVCMFKISLDTRKAGKVELCGSFDDWKVRHRLSYDKLTNTWYVALHLKKGKYFYKYIVDDNWMYNGAENLAKDDSGEINNVTVVG